MSEDLITIDVGAITEWAEKLNDKIAGVSERAAHMKPAFEAMRKIYIAELDEQFKTQGTFFLGSEWTPLNPRYAEWKAKHYPNIPAPFGILYRTGTMYESFTKEDHAQQIKVIEDQSMVFGSTVPYATHHQTGAGLPKRQIVFIHDRFRKQINRIATSWVIRGKISEDLAGEVAG